MILFFVKITNFDSQFFNFYNIQFHWIFFKKSFRRMNFNIFFFIDVFFMLSIIDLNYNVNYFVQRFEFIHRDYRIFDSVVQSLIEMIYQNDVILIHFIWERFEL